MQIAKHSVATITYTLTDNDGNIIDQAGKDSPFIFIHGIGNIIPGLENALAGKTSGDQLNVAIEAADAYGERDDNMVQVLNKDMFQGVDDVRPGMQFHAQTNHGMSVVTVTEVSGDEVTIDGNHPLAGMALNFDVTILDVRDATEDELAHGHVHAAGGCGHDH